MGLISGTDKTQWLLSNGIVVPRIPIGPLLPHNFIPFNWKAKLDHPEIESGANVRYPNLASRETT